MDQKKIVFIVGPTAVGKSNIGFALAKKLGGEIVSCDAMQVYKEVSIATNKPDVAMLSEVPHHLIDVISVSEEFDVAAFNDRALAAIEDILARNKIPIVVGGSGLYMEILLDGIFPSAGKNPELRQQLEKRAQEEGHQVLHLELQRVDPVASTKIHVNDVRRIIRALEVYQTLNVPISELQKNRQGGIWEKYDIRIYCFSRDRDELYQQINQRVVDMFERGIVDEIRNLKFASISQTARRIIGVEEIGGFLSEQYFLDKAMAMMQFHTRRYAKRQLTWFRHDGRLTWMMLDKENSSKKYIQRILSEVS